MKTFLLKLALGVTAILVAGLFFATIAYAGFQCYPSSGNCITQAHYSHTVENHSGTSSWSAGVLSQSKTPAISMDDIGFSYWTVQAWCADQRIDWWQYANGAHGDVHHNTSSYWASITRTKGYCANPNDRNGQSIGNHDFYENPYAHLYPYSFKWNYIP